VGFNRVSTKQVAKKLKRSKGGTHIFAFPEGRRERGSWVGISFLSNDGEQNAIHQEMKKGELHFVFFYSSDHRLRDFGNGS